MVDGGYGRKTMNKKVFWCTNCLNMSTRPRISFDSRGWCNACQWMEEKRIMDWTARQKELNDLLNKFRSENNSFDCLVPVSGGKDGSYVAYQLKHKYKMNPLTVTVRPDLSLEIGDKNLNNFINSGYNHIHISPDPKIMRRFNKFGLVEKGFPYYGWLTAIFTSVIRIALNYKIPLIFYGEDGEVEYGGSTKNKNKALFDVKYIKNVYLEDGYDKVLNLFKNEESGSLYFWQLPSDSEFSGNNISLTHWGYFEPWDSYRNYLVAKDNCNLQEIEEGNTGTFTNFAQNDQALCSLHYYLMYLKFGFGRATQDAGIEIRRGAMSRDQALNLISLYDGMYPEDLIPLYLDYYEMNKDEFDLVIDKWVNKDLFEKKDGLWSPKFTVE